MQRLGPGLDAAGTVLLADAWGPPAGVIQLHWRAPLLSSRPVAVVSTLLVAPDRRRSGVARLLLKAGSRAARVAGCGELRLEAGVHDADLRAFAASTGFLEASAMLVRSLRKEG